MNNTMKYKGFIGSVQYSDNDKVFFGKVEGIRGLVNFEATSVEELNAEFRSAVDDYIQFCKENNLPIRKSYTGTLNVRIPVEVHTRIAEISQQAGISINAFIKETLSKAVM